MLLQLKDGGIENIQDDQHYEPGCPTCDFGSQYINEFEITLTKYRIEAKVNQMYEYVFSAGDMMKIILPNIQKISEMTEAQFIEWFKWEVECKDGDFFNERKVEFKVVELQ